MNWLPYIISTVCLWILLSAILLNFYFSKQSSIVKEKKSVVETGSMLGFFVAVVVLVALRVGLLHHSLLLGQISAVVGTIFIIIGTAVNIAGRLTLKGNWGNQIRIYENHSLITHGIYNYIRHPLYSSTTLMLYGFSFLFINYLVFILVTLIFLPFMVYRAKQEDELLEMTFQDEFVKYKESTGMLLPKLRLGGKKQ